jgi:hypothetical protein
MTPLKTPNAKIAVSYLSFPLVTHMLSFDARFDGYELSMMGHSAEPSRQAGHRSEISGLRA